MGRPQTSNRGRDMEMTNNHEQPGKHNQKPVNEMGDTLPDRAWRRTIIAGKGAQGEALLYNGERPIDCFAKPRCEAAGATIPAQLTTMREGARTDLEPSAALREVSQEDAAKLC